MITESIKSRALAKIDKTGANGCWLWTASLDGRGYGQLQIGNRAHPRMARAHRIIYEIFRGPIPKGLDLDHLCRVPHCVNPDHLEPVTRGENLRRGKVGQKNRERIIAYTHCKNGHKYEKGSFRMRGRKGRKNPYRECLLCLKEYPQKAKDRLTSDAQARENRR